MPLAKAAAMPKICAEIIDARLQAKYIDYRFNKAFVQGITNLEEPQLTDFMFKYRPGLLPGYHRKRL
jgi:hypothetical protein